MLLGHPEQRSVSQIDRQIAVLPHPVRSWLRSAQPLLAVLPAQHPYVCNKKAPDKGAVINVLKFQTFADMRARMRREKAKAVPAPKIGRGPGTAAGGDMSWKLKVALKFSILP